VTDAPTEFSRFAPDVFFARARERLRAVSGIVGGDHVLNPGMADSTTYRDAAVLIPVLARSPLTMLFTLRTPRLSAHAGQVAFPGGKIDRGDAGPAAAALREAAEEIGLDPRTVTIIGALDPYLTGTGFRIMPVLGRVAPPPENFAINPDEVEEIFEVPLDFVLTPQNMRRGSRVLGGGERHFYEMEFGGHTIWGATAGIIVGLYQRIYG
jgi:8-oxo-dGTP pyrophosphatase MutT (NUDIX family)